MKTGLTLFPGIIFIGATTTMTMSIASPSTSRSVFPFGRRTMRKPRSQSHGQSRLGARLRRTRVWQGLPQRTGVSPTYLQARQSLPGVRSVAAQGLPLHHAAQTVLQETGKPILVQAQTIVGAAAAPYHARVQLNAKELGRHPYRIRVLTTLLPGRRPRRRCTL